MTVIPATKVDGPAYGCGHPKSEDNMLKGTGTNRNRSICKFCAKVRRMNKDAERRERRCAERMQRLEKLLSGG